MTDAVDGAGGGGIYDNSEYYDQYPTTIPSDGLEPTDGLNASEPSPTPTVDPIDSYEPPIPGPVTPPEDPIDPIDPVDPVVDATNPTVQDLYPNGGEYGDVVSSTPGTVADPTGASVTENNQSVSNIDTVGAADNATDRIGGMLDAGAGIDASQTELTAEQRVDEELARILGQDSPLLAQARAEAAKYANSRGLQNSSMAAGMTYDAMVKAGLPMAQQNAQQALQREMANTQLRQAADQFSAEEQTRLAGLEAELGQQLNLFNADQLNKAETIMAQMRTAMEQQDTDAYNRASQQLATLQRDASAQQAELDYRSSQAEADALNQRNSQIISSVTALNQQYMQNMGNADIANIQGTYQQLIAVNQTAGQIYNSMLSGIASIMDNPEMTPAQVASAVGEMQKMMEASLRMVASMNDLDLGDIGGTIPGGDTSDGATTPTYPNFDPNNFDFSQYGFG
jgi:hypothetical protein